MSLAKKCFSETMCHHTGDAPFHLMTNALHASLLMHREDSFKGFITEEVSYLLPLADKQAARMQPGSDPRQAVNPSVPDRHAVECCRLAERD